jgi:N-acetylneuraminic acid mutarotase
LNGNTGTQLYRPDSTPISNANVSFNLPHISNSAAVVLNGSAYIIGGYDAKTFSPVATMTVFDPTTNTSYSGASLNIPRQNHSATVVDDSIIVCGSIEGDDEPGRICEKYNSHTQKWQKIALLKDRTEKLCMATLNKQAHVFGGDNRNRSNVCMNTNAVYVYEQNVWREVWT